MLSDPVMNFGDDDGETSIANAKKYLLFLYVYKKETSQVTVELSIYSETSNYGHSN
jgi:hypothetical protein